MRPLKIFTWHVHGSYLYYLSQTPHEIYVPFRKARDTGYAGRTASYPWPERLKEVPAEEVRSRKFDCILFQSHKNYWVDQHEILSEEQKKLPRIFLEHDPPRGHPTDTEHPVNDPNVLVVHVTPFNDLMWNCGRSPTTVIEHGVMVPEDAAYSGELPRGLVVVNNIKSRGRRLGADVFEAVRERVPLDLIGMGWEQADGLGEIQHRELPYFQSRYRFFFNPIRYTSLGLAICEAMMVGVPIIGLATTELVTVIENGVSGFIDTRVERLIEQMEELLRDERYARKLSEGARRQALRRFHIERFKSDWNRAFQEVR